MGALVSSLKVCMRCGVVIRLLYPPDKPDEVVTVDEHPIEVVEKINGDRLTGYLPHECQEE
jgi:hypothetical protein